MTTLNNVAINFLYIYFFFLTLLLYSFFAKTMLVFWETFLRLNMKRFLPESCCTYINNQDPWRFNIIQSMITFHQLRLQNLQGYFISSRSSKAEDQLHLPRLPFSQPLRKQYLRESAHFWTSQFPTVPLYSEHFHIMHN